MFQIGKGLRAAAERAVMNMAADGAAMEQFEHGTTTYVVSKEAVNTPNYRYLATLEIGTDILHLYLVNNE